MNPDDLEKQLERLAWRPAPDEWRREILDAACPPRKVMETGQSPVGFVVGGLRWLYPSFAFAGLWALMMVCNGLLLVSGRPGPSPAGVLSNAAGMPTVWNLQIAELREVGQDVAGVPSHSPLLPAGKPLTRPRSDRRRAPRLGSLEEAGQGPLPA